MNLKLRLRGDLLLQDLVEYEPAVERGHQVRFRVAPGRDELTNSINTLGNLVILYRWNVYSVHNVLCTAHLYYFLLFLIV